ncbi:uncharacterized protein LOC126834657 [Adelges cooleyi]|uniref:uncharacterized protein LOC126834657 n=1 Tax=Adelges cooleyi TaxID=133065 RepID=UPI00217FFB8A|nr:uncharacterized protein LOC126834657 [Adelges cooleyi]
MYTKYIILFCFTYYYIPTVISFDESLDYENRFNQIRYATDDYITFNSLSKTYDNYEVDELQYVIDTYAVDFYGENDYYQRRMYLEKFILAAKDGLIHRFHTWEMINLFLQIIGKDAERGYITHNDLASHYENKMSTAQIETVMTTYGTPHSDGLRLSFFGFRRAINTLLIPH